MIVLKVTLYNFTYYDLIAISISLVIFTLPVMLNMAFGGGDIRFGVFATLLVGLDGLGYFLIVSAILHILFLKVLKRKTAGFAPAMSMGAVSVYLINQFGVI